MKMIKISPKQEDFLKTLWSLKYNFNLAFGVTGSGKTHITNIGFYNMLDLCPAGDDMAIIGFTKGSAFNNVIEPLLKWDSESENRLKRCNSKYGEYLTDTFNNIKIYIFGADNEGSFKTLRGLNLFCILCDEATLYNDNAINEICFRLRYVNENDELTSGFSIMTGNPHKNNSFAKRKLVDNEKINKKLYVFDFYDNPTMTQEYIDLITESSSGVMKKRLVEGLWVDNSDDAVIPEDIIEWIDEIPRYDRVIAHLDYAFGGGIQTP